MRSGLEPKEAARGAKELFATVGKPTGKSVIQSAKTFIDNGLTQTELKLNLLDKHGDKLRASQARNMAAKTAENFQNKIYEARKYY